MKRWILLIIVGLGLAYPIRAWALTEKGVPNWSIKSSDGHVTVGFEKEFGGAISYIKDDRVSDGTNAKGNLINNSNSGALFSTAIWTLIHWPDKVDWERGLRWCDNRTKKLFPKPSGNVADWQANKIECYKIGTTDPSVIPFNNPTQGGVANYAWSTPPSGINPNPTTLNINNNRASISTRLVNWNYSLDDVIPSASDANLWQTDVWMDEDVYFHPTIPGVIVVDQKVTYCKDMNDGCKSKPLMFQDNQLSTLFPAVKTYAAPFDGPISKYAFKVNGSVLTHAAGTVVDGSGVVENWQAALTDKNEGIGEAVYKGRASKKWQSYGDGYGSVGGGDALGWSQPDLSSFENSGITAAGGDDPRYTFSPGGWYKFRTFIATGSLQTIRQNLLMAQDPVEDPDNLNGKQIDSNIIGYTDSAKCNLMGGWATYNGNAADKITVEAHFYTDDGASYTQNTTANVYRSDLGGVCPPDGKCAFNIVVGNLPENFRGKKVKIKVWGKSSSGKYNLLTYGDNVETVTGPCSNVASPSNTPTMTPTATPTNTPVPTSTPKPTNTPVPTNTAIPTTTLVPTNTIVPTATPKPKVLGDADGDGVVTINDGSIWRAEFIAGNLGAVPSSTWKADFDGDGKVTINDASIWRAGLIKQLTK